MKLILHFSGGKKSRYLQLAKFTGGVCRCLAKCGKLTLKNYGNGLSCTLARLSNHRNLWSDASQLLCASCWTITFFSNSFQFMLLTGCANPIDQISPQHTSVAFTNTSCSAYFFAARPLYRRFQHLPLYSYSISFQRRVWALGFFFGGGGPFYFCVIINKRLESGLAKTPKLEQGENSSFGVSSKNKLIL